MGKITSALTHREAAESAPRPGAIALRDPERVVCVIDTSGSMSDPFGATTRIEAVINSLLLILDASSRNLTHYGLVQFNSSVTVLSRITNRFSAVKSAALRLSPAGGTQYGPALREALKHEPQRIILLSDGEASDKTRALEHAEYCKKNEIKIDCIAVGNVGVSLLKEIARITGGMYIEANDVEKLNKAFLRLETRTRLLENKSAEPRS